MIVIRSKVNKGKVHSLAEQIRQLFGKGKILIIDTQYCSDIFEFITDYTQIEDMSRIEKIVKNESDYYNYFALNLCVGEHEINYYKQMEDKYKTQFILTVQEYADSKNEEVLVETI